MNFSIVKWAALQAINDMIDGFKASKEGLAVAAIIGSATSLLIFAFILIINGHWILFILDLVFGFLFLVWLTYFLTNLIDKEYPGNKRKGTTAT